MTKTNSSRKGITISGWVGILFNGLGAVLNFVRERSGTSEPWMMVGVLTCYSIAGIGLVTAILGLRRARRKKNMSS